MPEAIIGLIVILAIAGLLVYLLFPGLIRSPPHEAPRHRKIHNPLPVYGLWVIGLVLLGGLLWALASGKVKWQSAAVLAGCMFMGLGILLLRHPKELTRNAARLQTFLPDTFTPVEDRAVLVGAGWIVGGILLIFHGLGVF